MHAFELWKEEKVLREFNHTQVKLGMNYKCSISSIYVRCFSVEFVISQSEKEGLMFLMHLHQKRMN